MFIPKEEKSTNAWIAFSRYGLQSHIITNSYGVSFSCNPECNEMDNIIIYPSKEEAIAKKGSFYNEVTNIQFSCEVKALTLY
jgi:hypothetical protein